jgi:hypothetical protein
MPLTSYFYSVWIADQLFHELGIEASLVHRKISVLEQFGFSEHRGVISVYEFLEDPTVAEAKIRQRVLAHGKSEDERDPDVALGWQVGDHPSSELKVRCLSWPTAAIGPNSIWTDRGQLIIEVLTLSSPYCQLR